MKMSDEMIQTESSVFERELRRLILEEKRRITEILVGGHSIENIETYRENVGRIASLDLVLDLCEEAQKIVNRTL